MKVAIIIPTYNEKENIIPLIHELARITKIHDLDANIIVVDDNSPDGTGDEVANLKLKTQNSKLFLIRRKKKEGLGKAYLEGFRFALKNGADFVLAMDADFSHSPSDIPRLLQKAKDYDIVVGSRYVKGGEMSGFDFTRRFLSKGAISLARVVLGLKTKDVTAGFKCYSRRFIESLNSNEIAASGYAFQVEVIKKAEKNGFSVVEIPIVFSSRKFGESKLSLLEAVSSAWALLKILKMERTFPWKKIFSPYFYENIFKYNPLAQTLFLKRTISLDFPAFLNIELTNHCNASCITCPRKKMNRPLGYVSFDLFKKIIDEVSQNRLPGQLTLNKDGEPLLHPEIEKLVSYAKEKNTAHRTEIYTNGILLDKKMSEKLIQSGLDILYVSLDAVSPETFSKIKGVNLLNKVVGNTLDFIAIKRKFNSLRPILVVKMVLTLDNFKEAKQFKKFWKGKADNVVLSSFHTWEGSVEDRGIVQKRDKRYPCPVPWYNPVINWDGKVSACCVNIDENELIMGDIKKESLKEIWQNEKFKKLREAQLNQDFSSFPTCQRCGFWKILPNLSSFLERIDQKDEKA